MENRKDTYESLSHSEIGLTIDEIKKLEVQVTFRCSIFGDHYDLRKQTPFGGVAQLGEHLPCKQGVKGSIPFISTKMNENQ